jgi:GTPase SAR1 family protein
LLIWDTAGQEMYRSMIKMYYRGIHAAIIVFDLGERKSFDSVEHWFKDIREKQQAKI